MASFVVVGQNAEFFSTPYCMLWRCLGAGLRSTPKYSEVLWSTRSTSEYSWSKLGVLQSTPELLRNTPEYSRVLPSTPKYSKTLYGENINFCYV
eukprot:scaffold8797_cov155-Skeletonema_dohrnii-CCMP3373.AAC.1